eukprot:SAG11_NODE_5459_length_1554_cov_0.996564_1_plen_82_part_00
MCVADAASRRGGGAGSEDECWRNEVVASVAHNLLLAGVNNHGRFRAQNANLEVKEKLIESKKFNQEGEDLQITLGNLPLRM